MTTIPRSRALLPLILAIVGVLVADAMVFGPSGPYWRWAKPDSFAGQVATVVVAETARATDPRRDVLVLGDSRIKLGVSRPLAEQAAADLDLHFRVVGIEGSRQRTWSYLLRRLDPDADRYAAIVVPLLEFNDRDIRYTGGDNTTDPAQAASDLRALLPLVHPWDAPRVLSGFEGTQNLDLALRVLFLKGLAYRDDLLDYGEDPDRRRDGVENMRRIYERVAVGRRAARKSLRGIEESIDGDRIDWPEPTHVNELSQARLEQVLRGGRVEPSGNRARYHAEWLGGIARRYADSDTRVILMPFPRSPLLRPEDRPTETSGLPARLAEQGWVDLMDEGIPRALERPEAFADHIHLNLEGMQYYSAYAGQEVARILRERRDVPGR